MSLPIKSKKTQAAQVYFPVGLYLQIKEQAKLENKSLAKWLRDLALKELQKNNKKRKSLLDLPSYEWDDVDPHLSENIKKELYGRS